MKLLCLLYLVLWLDPGSLFAQKEQDSSSHIVLRGGSRWGRMPLVIIDDRLPDSTRLASQGPIAITKNPMDVIKVLINPDDIGSITVLKDDAAVALYGDKGKDGVILITTRKTKEIRVKPLRE